MNKLQTFEQFLSHTGENVPVLAFLVILLLAAVLAYILSVVYIRYGHALSNRRLSSKNFLLITMTTMLIITIVKSSLALSLGLVGALSIVRFRAAIKEPEELSYLFLTIAVGLGMGANQTIITLLGFLVIVSIIIVRKKNSSAFSQNKNLHLVVGCDGPEKIQLERIVELLNSHCSAVNMKRFDESKEAVEASFLVEFKDFDQLNLLKNALRKENDSIRLSFLDNRGLA
ncbi:MAG: DUF4956 domain-containing protein [bacterium]|nr:DUF4956 domain-containing protein [bacterium]